VSDWRGYDAIADRYDRMWSTRFEAVARRIWTLLPVRIGADVLDIGAGTGIVLKVLTEMNPKVGTIVMVRSFGGDARASKVAGARIPCMH